MVSVLAGGGGRAVVPGCVPADGAGGVLLSVAGMVRAGQARACRAASRCSR